MKKTAIETQEEIAKEEQNRQVDDEHWYIDLPQTKSNKDGVK